MFKPPGCYLCLWIELHMHRQQVHKSGVLVSTDRGVRKTFLYQRHRQTWVGTSRRDSNFSDHTRVHLFCPIRAGFPNCKSCTITLWMQPIDLIFSAPENSTLIPLFSASSKNLWLLHFVETLLLFIYLLICLCHSSDWASGFGVKFSLDRG